MSNTLSPDSDHQGLPVPQRWLATAAVLVGTTVSVLDSSITTVALPTIAREFSITPAIVIWVSNSYQLVTAIFMVALAALGDKIGYRPVYLTGLILFTLASLACALSPGFFSLVAARAFQGLGSAAMMSVGPALSRTLFPARLLGTSLGLTALVVASAAAAGPMVGGLILAIADWPWLFAINLPFGIASLILGLIYLPHHGGRGGRFDMPGAVLVGIAMGSLVLGVDGLSKHTPPEQTALLLGASVLAWSGFIAWQRRIPSPLLPLNIFRSLRFSLAAVTSLCSFTSQGLAYIALPFLFQGFMGYSPLMSGLLFIPWPLTIMVAAPVAGWLADRHGARIVSTAGLLVFVSGLAALALIPEGATIPDILWRAALSGLGFGLFQSPNNRELMGAVPLDRSGAASGVLASARTFGQSLGQAAAAVVLAIPSMAMGVGTIRLALGLASGVAGGALLCSLIRTRAGK